MGRVSILLDFYNCCCSVALLQLLKQLSSPTRPEMRLRPASRPIFPYTLIGLKLRRRTISTAVRNMEPSITAAVTQRYPDGRKCFEAYFRRLTYQYTSRHRPLQPCNTVATLMSRCNFGHIANFKAQIAHALAEVHVFKPQWMELCVKTAQPLPHIAPEHQKGSGRLFGLRRSLQIQIQAAITPVHWIARKQTIDPKYLEHQRQRRGKAPQRETRLRFACLVHQFPRR